MFQTKITLKIVGEDAVKELQTQAEAKGLVAAIVRDAGKPAYPVISNNISHDLSLIMRS